MMKKKDENRKKERGTRGKKGLCNLYVFVLAILSRKHNLSGPVFKNPGRFILHVHALKDYVDQLFNM